MPIVARGTIREPVCEMNPGRLALNAVSGRLTLTRSRPPQQSCHISIDGVCERHCRGEGDVLFPRLNERDVLLKQACDIFIFTRAAFRLAPNVATMSSCLSLSARDLPVPRLAIAMSLHLG